MLYDNGANTPNIAPRPSFANNGNLPPSLFANQPGNIGKFNRYMPPRRATGGTPIPAPAKMPMYQPPMGQQPLGPNTHKFLSAYGKTGGGMYTVGPQQQPLSGWGYMRNQPPTGQFTPAVPYGQPQQYQGNPFMPAVPY